MSQQPTQHAPQSIPYQTDAYYELDLRDIFRMVRKHITLIISLPLIAGLIAGVAVFYIIDPTYQASTTMLVIQETPADAQIIYNDIRANREIVKTYREIARSRTILTQVISELNLDLTPDGLRDHIDVSLRGETEIIEFTVQHQDPLLAKAIAGQTAQVFMERIQHLMKIDNVTQVDPPEVADKPVKPQKKLTVAIAIMLGGMVAVGFSFLLEYLDNTIKTPLDIERALGLPILGTIPQYKEVN